MTSEQTTAINAALALYAEKIERIENSINSDYIWVSNTKGGSNKPTAESIRALERQAHGRLTRDKFIAERNALAAAFGITL